MRREDDQLLLSASDLSAHLGCGHRTQLGRRAALGQLEAPPPDPALAVLQERGLAHEQAYLEHLGSKGPIEHIDLVGAPLNLEGLEATRKAMASGADVITQAPLVSGRFRGRADVLLKIDTPCPALGPWSYRVVDTKLASETRGGTILQLCLYSRIVGELQDQLPEEFWVVSPGGFESPDRFRTTDYLAIARRVEADLAQSVDGEIPEEPSAPEPVQDCDVCQWWARCDKQRREVDHLSFVAGISRLQRRELEHLGIRTLTDLAGASLPLEPVPRRGSPESYERVREQARVQRDSIGREPLVEFLLEADVPRDDGRRIGLARLPEPSTGDVFLDLEGDSFVEGGGLEYLFGWITIDDDGKAAYARYWALTEANEKAAFEELIDFLMERWKAYPDFAVYHFGHYEPSALKRLMGRHATRAEELDRLLRGERFVDLHSVVHESMRIGVEVYGLKQLEAVHGYERELDLREASLHKHRLERALELGVPEDAPEDAAAYVEAYNKDDCISTWRLRDWLEEKRKERTAAGIDLPRPVLGEGMPSEAQEERSADIQALMDALLGDVPTESEDRDEEQQARWLLAHLLEWHRREGKAGWWDFFRLADLPPAALRDEKNGLFGLEFVERIPQGRKLPIDRYRFPRQEHDVRRDRKLFVSKDQQLGSVEAIDLVERTVDVKKRGDAIDLDPEAVFVQDRVRPDPIPAALERLAREVAENGVDGPGAFRAARDLLMARAPRLHSGSGGEMASAGETTREAAARLALDLAESVLPAQGPPGTGKTYTGARVVCELVRAGQKVGIAGPSHKVIRNLLDEVVKAAAEEGLEVRILQRVKKGEATGGGPIQKSDKSDCLSTGLRSGEIDVAAGTAWAWARDDCEALVDTLVIDEAGQFSLANALAAATAAHTVLLLGDPQQLEQPIQGSHPEGCDRSALEHLLGDHDTVPPDRGLFLGTTWRLHPSIRAFTSELFYEGRLDNHENCARQELTGPTPLAGAGLWLALTEHEGNTSSSPEEVEQIVSLVEAIVTSENGWIDFDGAAQPLTHEELRIVSPYNAQVSALQGALPHLSEQIGTVDRFQGQEAPVVIYSMATSSIEEAPRGLEFLFSLNRLNVATSRARCTCVLVASPALFDAECRTPRQMKLVNALCRYREMAQLLPS